MRDDLLERDNDWTIDEWDDGEQVAVVEPTRREHRLLKWVVWAALAMVVVLVLVAGYIGWWYLGKVQPEAANPGEIRSFTVADSDTIDSVSTRLEAVGLIDDADVFEWYIDQQGGIELSPGFYQIRTGDHMGNVLASLRVPPSETYTRITFPEGFTIEQMGVELAEGTERLAADSFVGAATSGSIRSAFSPDGQNSLEGLLFPDTYQVSNADNAGQVVESMVSLMERVASQENLESGAADLGLSPYQVLIVASMIEREAKVEEDRAKIARVIYNRLGLDMLLQIDATLYYDVPDDFAGNFADLRQIDGPYNTYQRTGLPPTPIANPGRASIRAALNPAPNPPAGDPICQDLTNYGLDPTVNCAYLYYVLADADGSHAFAAIPEQHEANVQAARDAGLL